MVGFESPEDFDMNEGDEIEVVRMENCNNNPEVEMMEWLGDDIEESVGEEEEDSSDGDESYGEEDNSDGEMEDESGGDREEEFNELMQQEDGMQIATDFNCNTCVSSVGTLRQDSGRLQNEQLLALPEKVRTLRIEVIRIEDQTEENHGIVYTSFIILYRY